MGHHVPYDPKMNLYADFYIKGAECAIIECKVRPSAANIAKGLGQCLWYRYNTHIKHFVLCMPEVHRDEWWFNYEQYKEFCRKYDIGFATEENVIDVLEEVVGSLDVFHKLSSHPLG